MILDREKYVGFYYNLKARFPELRNQDSYAGGRRELISQVPFIHYACSRHDHDQTYIVKVVAPDRWTVTFLIDKDGVKMREVYLHKGSMIDLDRDLVEYMLTQSEENL